MRIEGLPSFEATPHHRDICGERANRGAYYQHTHTHLMTEIGILTNGGRALPVSTVLGNKARKIKRNAAWSFRTHIAQNMLPSTQSLTHALSHTYCHSVSSKRWRNAVESSGEANGSQLAFYFLGPLWPIRSEKKKKHTTGPSLLLIIYSPASSSRNAFLRVRTLIMK